MCLFSESHIGSVRFSVKKTSRHQPLNESVFNLGDNDNSYVEGNTGGGGVGNETEEGTNAIIEAIIGAITKAIIK